MYYCDGVSTSLNLSISGRFVVISRHQMYPFNKFVQLYQLAFSPDFIFVALPSSVAFIIAGSMADLNYDRSNILSLTQSCGHLMLRILLENLK